MLPLDPITATVGAIGLGLKLFGGFGQSGAAKQEAQLSGQNASLQGQVNDQRRQQMELSAYRSQLEDIRNTQRARAAGINAAVAGGAQYGSGLAGGTADTENQGLFNLQGVQQNLQIGRNIFGLDSKISANNVQIANLKGTEATDAGWASLGGSLMQGAGTISNLSKFGSGSGGGWGFGSLFMGGGSPSGY
jgi:hypothetical protein